MIGHSATCPLHPLALRYCWASAELGRWAPEQAR